MPNFFALQGKIQNYQWGGFNFIPHLLAQTADPASPAAEYWLGAHPAAPSTVVTGDPMPIAELLQAHRLQLNFLFKVLDVRDMLSIQVHPSKAQAQAGFERENQAGISLDAKHRNYKDTSDKPELMVALSRFWLLHGFRSLDAITAALRAKPYLDPLLTRLEQQGLDCAFRFALDLEDAQVQQMHQDLAADLAQAEHGDDRLHIEFWIRRWLQSNPHTQNGLLTLFFFNLVQLEPGEAIYQPPNLPHAYLEGQNIEVMASSDNVLRAGLTPKHIDVPELMAICNFQPSDPTEYVIAPELESNGHKVFTTPFEAFELFELHAERGAETAWPAESVELLFCYHGHGQLSDQQGDTLALHQGQAILILPGSRLRLNMATAETVCFRARNKPG